MNEFEQELRRKLQNFEVPPGFSRRVMESVRRADAQRSAVTLRRRAIAASLLLASGMGAWGAHRYQAEQRAKAAQARHEFTLAMQITAKSLDAAASALRQIQTPDQIKEEKP